MLDQTISRDCKPAECLMEMAFGEGVEKLGFKMLGKIKIHSLSFTGVV